MSDLTGRPYRVPGAYKRVFEHWLREKIASLPDLPEFARDADTADQVGEVVLVWRPVTEIKRAG